MSSLDKRGLHHLFSADMLWIAWLPVIVIGAFHYGLGSHHHWAHDVLRRLYYFPILFAAFSRGLGGGLTVALVCSVSYAPHAFFVMEESQDPGTTLNKLLEIVLYNAIGILAGVLADRETKRRKQAEQAFAEQQKMAEQLVRAQRLSALGALVAGIAHEIKNPLHTIKGTAEIVDDVIPKEAEQAGIWTLLKQEVNRLERIADRFLSFARPSTPDLQDHDFETLFQRISELVQAQLYSSEVKLETALPTAELSDSRLRVDPDQLAQVALNITGNAVKAMEGKGRVIVSSDLETDEQARWVAIRIENDGPTIPQEDLERIFDPFYTGYGDGTGLGLSLSHKIIEAHGGYIRVENTGDRKGVAFTIRLPECSKRERSI